MWLCLCEYVCMFGVGVGVGQKKYSWHNIIGWGPYGKLAASYLSLSSLEAKISTLLFVALSWTPTTVIGLIIKKKKSPAGTATLPLPPHFVSIFFFLFTNFPSNSVFFPLFPQKYSTLTKLASFQDRIMLIRPIGIVLISHKCCLSQVPL